MSLEIVCPICEYKNISVDAKQCPQCDSDLTCFRLLDSLPDEMVEVSETTPVQKRLFFRRDVTLAVMALFVVSGVFAYVLLGFEARLQRQRERVARIETQLPDALVSLRSGHRHASSNRAPERRGVHGERAGTSTGDEAVAESGTGSDCRPLTRAPRSRAEGWETTRSRHDPRRPNRVEERGDNERGFFVYQPGNDETLWGIAQKFYGAGRLYPVLLEYNPDLEIHRIWSGLKIKVLEDAQTAMAVFKRITEIDSGKRYWYYTVQQGETVKSIAKKFYGPSSSTEAIVRDNLRTEIAIGSRIKIRVD